VLQQFSLSISERGSATIGSLKVYPELLPLFIGEVRPARVGLENADIKAVLPAWPEKKRKEERLKGEEKKKTKTLPLSTIKEAVSAIAAQLDSKPIDLVVMLKNGRLNLSADEKLIFRFQKIQARILLQPEEVEVDLVCSSNLWESASLQAWLVPRELKGGAQIYLARFQPHLLAQYLSPTSPYKLNESLTNLGLSFRLNGPNDLQGDLQGSLPYLALSRGKKEVVVIGKSMNVGFQAKESDAEVIINELELKYPQLSVTGELLLGQASPRISLELRGTDADVRSTRETLLTLFGDFEAIQDIFKIVRGGKVPRIKYATRGDSIADLEETENILITGHMSNGIIHVPDADLKLNDVHGDVVISKGFLEGRNLEARLGNTLGREGTLKLGLEGDQVPFHLDILIQADLARLPSRLKGWVDIETFVKEIDLLENFKGNATGRLILGENTASIRPRVDVSEFSLSTKYGRVPYPIEIKGGHFSYDETGIDVKNLHGKLGSSSISGLSGRLDLENTPHLDLKAGESVVSLDEIHAWLAGVDRRSDKREAYEKIKGVLDLSTLVAKGPLLEPENWNWGMTGKIRQVTVAGESFPGPLTITGGHIAEDLDRDRITIRDADIAMLDASLKASGVIDGIPKTLLGIDVDLRGNLKPESIRWLSDLVDLPPELKIRSPLSIAQAHLIWNRDMSTSVKGDLVVNHGPKVSVNVLKKPQELMVKNVQVEDDDSQASLQLNVKEKEFGLKFAGHLSATTRGRLFERNYYGDSRIEGNIQVNVSLDQPMQSSARGRLIGRNIIFPYRVVAPLKIEAISLLAEENEIQVKNAACTWGKSRMTLAGNVSFSEKEILFDMGLAADVLHWNDFKKIADKDGGKEGSQKGETLWDAPVRGTVNLIAKEFNYDKHTWSPLHASVSFNPKTVNAIVTKGDLCGISTPGVLRLTAEEIALDFQPISRGQELDTTILCLWNVEDEMTGTYDLAGEIAVKDENKGLIRSSHGKVVFSAENGRIQRRKGVLGNLFDLLNLTEMFRGKLPDLGKEGYAYNSIKVEGDLEHGVLKLNEAVMDGSSMGIACLGEVDLVDEELELTVLVAPLRTVDFIVRNTPVVGRILGGNLVSIPYKVEGDWGDPQVTPIPPSAVGFGLLGIMERTLKLPITIMQPLVPSQKQQEEKPEDKKGEEKREE
jgi:hypothetical protein